MRTDAYWENRAGKREELAFQRAQQAQKELSGAYHKAYQDIENDIGKLYARYGSRNKMTAEEAGKRLSARETESWSADMRKQISGITDVRRRRELQDKLDETLAMRYRVSRLEALKEGVDVRLAKLANAETDIDTGALMDIVDNEYYRHIYDLQRGTGIGFSFKDLDTGTTREILRNNWSGEHYSKRIWNNTSALASEVKKTLTAGIETGRGYRAMTRDIMEKFSARSYEAARLVHTEASAMYNAADLAAYGEAEIERARFVATLDKRTSELCNDMDGQEIDCDKLVQGKNLPPLHPWCRSCTVAALDRDLTEGWTRRALDPETGKGIEIPYNMTYREWRDKHTS